MITEAGLPVEERILQVLRHLGISQAHFAGRLPRDLTGLATTYPEVFLSLTLVGPTAVNPHTVGRLAPRLLVFNGDQGPLAERVRRVVESAPGARLVSLRDYAILGWTDVVAERTDEIGSTMTQFLAKTNPLAGEKSVPSATGEGEMAGISYRIRGAGPPLVLLPLFPCAFPMGTAGAPAQRAVLHHHTGRHGVGGCGNSGSARSRRGIRANGAHPDR